MCPGNQWCYGVQESADRLRIPRFQLRLRHWGHAEAGAPTLSTGLSQTYGGPMSYPDREGYPSVRSESREMMQSVACLW